MKLKDALELGKSKGYNTRELCVNYVLMHSFSMFHAAEIDNELTELIVDTINSGGQLCPKCGFLLPEDSEECYMCQLLDEDWRMFPLKGRRDRK